MPVDINGQFYGQLYGQDRIGQTTPDLESSEWLRPWLPVAYPAPWLPTLRQDQGHPKLAGIVIGAHQLVGQDKNGGLVPAGLFSGTQPNKANGGQYCVIVYQPWDVGFAYNPQTGIQVQVAGEHACLAAPSDAVPGDVVTLPNGTTIAITLADINFAWTCDLFTCSVTGSNTSAAGVNVPVAPVIAASTLALGSKAVYTFSASGDTLQGSLAFQVGAAGVPVTVNLVAGSTLTVAAAAITTAIAAAVTAGELTAGEVTASTTLATITITGPVDAAGTVAGTNTLVLVSDVEEQSISGVAMPFSYRVVRPIGCAVRNVYQYIGGVLLGQNASASPSATGINYTLDGNVPLGFNVLNYMHEMGTAIQTQFVLKLPWIGATPTSLTSIASGDGVTGYLQAFGRTFTHFTGALASPTATPQGSGNGSFGFGSGVVASNAANGSDAGNFAPFNPAIHSPMDLVGRVIGIQNLSPVGFLNRVRTLFDRPMVGPMVDPNPAAIRMGGSATGGIPYHISVTTDAIFKRAFDQGKPLHPEYSTHILVRVNL